MSLSHQSLCSPNSGKYNIWDLFLPDSATNMWKLTFKSRVYKSLARSGMIVCSNFFTAGLNQDRLFCL